MRTCMEHRYLQLAGGRLAADFVHDGDRRDIFTKAEPRHPCRVPSLIITSCRLAGAVATVAIWALIPGHHPLRISCRNESTHRMSSALLPRYSAADICARVS